MGRKALIGIFLTGVAAWAGMGVYLAGERRRGRSAYRGLSFLVAVGIGGAADFYIRACNSVLSFAAFGNVQSGCGGFRFYTL